MAGYHTKNVVIAVEDEDNQGRTKRSTRTIKAAVHPNGLLAIHPGVDYDYTITHVPTGCRLNYGYLSYQDAVDGVGRLIASGVSWDFTEKKLKKDHKFRNRVREVIETECGTTLDTEPMKGNKPQ